ncbi:DUF4870 domain-containing protein [Thermococcus sp. M39]|uniref:DUF4870 domain-containing protein n=1 Tax=unclassified Thermococcus TaxID=2627626 RepID=UPI00143A01C7|nr:MULTISPECIES: DUF4870 domain-containing protein [unclassified Thermococcus]NJE07395.1 DUF4870 domain-containing protein [Thermococcus sp. M39]NJE12474.1 DUF4870 domain-containing protein [Thermococcus sp. LS2]
MEKDESGVIKKSETSLGLEENVEAALAYVLGFLTGIIFLLLEKESEFVRFHAMQSTITFLGIFILQQLLRFIPFLGGILAMLLSLVGLVLWILGIVKAYQGEYYKFPIVGGIAENQVKKMSS